MRLEFYDEKKLKKEIKNITNKYLKKQKYKIFFFGSRVTGYGDKHSDIDIGIEGDREIPFEIMAHLKEEIENLPLLYKIDVVDFKKKSLNFRNTALQNIELIYDKT